MLSLKQSQARTICKKICKLHNWKVFLLLEVGSHCHLRAIIQEFTCGPTTRKQSSPNPRGDDGNPPSGHQVARRYGGDGGAAAAVAGRNLSYYFNSLHIQLQTGSIIRQIIQSWFRPELRILIHQVIYIFDYPTCVTITCS